MKKCIFTLCVDDYAPQITALTFPLMKEFADKIRAEFHIITERRFPEWPITYEKLQIHELGKGNDWNWFFDADTLVHPEMYDVTEMIHKDTVCHNGKDFASIRWTYDNYFRRDGRHTGSCNWCTVGSDWCLDLWHPLDISAEEAIRNIHVTIDEENSGLCKPEHLIDDYALSRNIARYGLKVTTIAELIERFRLLPYLWHKYSIPNDQKLREILAVLSTKHHQPAFVEPGEPLQGPAGMPPAVLTADKRVVQACGMGWGLMSLADLADYQAEWGLNGPLPVAAPVASNLATAL